MVDGSSNLTGEWWGNYSYPASLGPETPFIAKIRDHGPGFEGTIMEPDTVTGSGNIEASINGVKSGSSVDFIKTYRASAPDDYQDPIDYVGSVSSDGNMITGTWSLFEFDGSFEMFRETAAKSADGQQVDAGIDLTLETTPKAC